MRYVGVEQVRYVRVERVWYVKREQVWCVRREQVWCWCEAWEEMIQLVSGVLRHTLRSRHELSPQTRPMKPQLSLRNTRSPLVWSQGVDHYSPASLVHWIGARAVVSSPTEEVVPHCELSEGNGVGSGLGTGRPGVVR